MFRVRPLFVTLVSLCMGLTACVTAAPISTAAPIGIPTTFPTSTPPATVTPEPTPTPQLPESLSSQKEELEKEGYVFDGGVLYDMDEDGERNEVLRFSADGSVIIKDLTPDFKKAPSNEALMLTPEQAKDYRFTPVPSKGGNGFDILVKKKNRDGEYETTAKYVDEANAWQSLSFANKDIAESYGYVVDDLKEQGYVGVEKGSRDFAGINYDCLLGTKDDGSTKIIGFEFNNDFVPITEDQVNELSSDLASRNLLNFEKTYAGDARLEQINVGVISTGKMREITFPNQDRITGFIGLINSSQGPRFVFVPLQSFRADNPNEAVFDIMWSLSHRKYEFGQLVGLEDMQKWVPYGSSMEVGLPLKYSAVAWGGKPGNYFLAEHFYDNTVYMSDFNPFLETKGDKVPESEILVLAFMGIREVKMP